LTSGIKFDAAAGGKQVSQREKEEERERERERD
jgi:hypothetical protein